MRAFRNVATVFFLAVLLAGANAVADGIEEEIWEGHITDEMCGKEHMMDGMSHPECATACVEMGAALQLFVPAEDEVYVVDDQQKLMEFAGTDVVVTGVLNEDTKTVTIHSIKAK